MTRPLVTLGAELVVLWLIGSLDAADAFVPGYENLGSLDDPNNPTRKRYRPTPTRRSVGRSIARKIDPVSHSFAEWILLVWARFPSGAGDDSNAS